MNLTFILFFLKTTLLSHYAEFTGQVTDHVHEATSAIIVRSTVSDELDQNRALYNDQDQSVDYLAAIIDRG